MIDRIIAVGIALFVAVLGKIYFVGSVTDSVPLYDNGYLIGAVVGVIVCKYVVK